MIFMEFFFLLESFVTFALKEYLSSYQFCSIVQPWLTAMFQEEIQEFHYFCLMNKMSHKVSDRNVVHLIDCIVTNNESLW